MSYKVRLLLLLIIIFPYPSFSQDRGDDTSLSPEALGLDTSTPDTLPPEMQAVFGSLLADFQHSILEMKRRQKDYVPSESPPAVIKYVRGKVGVPFPKPEEIKTFEVTAEQRKALEKMTEKMWDQTAKRLSKKPSLSACKVSQTLRQDMDFEGTRDDGVTLYDALFIKKEDIPNLHSQVFGEFTQLRPFVSDNQDVMSLGAVGAGIPCLPYRIRVTKGTLYIDEGDNALRNYDRTGAGGGEFHEIIAKRLRNR